MLYIKTAHSGKPSPQTEFHPVCSTFRAKSLKSGFLLGVCSENIRKGGRSPKYGYKCTATWQTFAAHRHPMSWKATLQTHAPERVGRQGYANRRRKKSQRFSAGFFIAVVDASCRKSLSLHMQQAHPCAAAPIPLLQSPIAPA